MRRGVLVMFFFLFFAVSLANSQAPARNGSPQFEQYPISESWFGTAAPIKLKTHSDRLFRTQFRNAAKEPPNFAGHFRLTMWGCGTQCIEGGIVDLSTGQLLQIPYSEQPHSGWPTGEEKWVVCYSAFGEHEAVETRRDSRLLIVRCADVIKKDGGSYEHTFYFVFERNRFRKLGDEVGERVF